MTVYASTVSAAEKRPREFARDCAKEHPWHAGDTALVLAELGRMRGALAGMVRCFEEETSQGDGVSESHAFEYGYAKTMLKRGAP